MSAWYDLRPEDYARRLRFNAERARECAARQREEGGRNAEWFAQNYEHSARRCEAMARLCMTQRDKPRAGDVDFRGLNNPKLSQEQEESIIRQIELQFPG